MVPQAHKDEFLKDLALAKLMLSVVPPGTHGGDIASSLLMAAAINAIMTRNRQDTLVEHFDGVRSMYATVFKLLQNMGIEQHYENLRARHGS